MADIFMRAKFRIDSVNTTVDYDQISATPVTNGSKEDNSFSKYTPSGTLTMTITNPELMGKITPGDLFYMDFTRA